MPPLTAIIPIVLGAVALLLGRRLFWLFAAIVGFAIGWWLVGLFFHGSSTLQLILGVSGGLFLAIMTRGLGQWAIRIVAGLAGFVMLPVLLGDLGMLGGIHELIWSMLGAVLGFVFALFMADSALIILSALLGAGLIMSGAQQLVPISQVLHLIGGFVLIIIGVMFQAR